MKLTWNIFPLLFVCLNALGQPAKNVVKNPIEPPESIQYNYYADTDTHDFSGNWDFDGDGDTDQLLFIGNGGAHVFYYPSIKLSSHQTSQEFDFLWIEYPAPAEFEKLSSASFYPPPLFPQLVVHDFDKDGIDEIYLRIQETEVELEGSGPITSVYIYLDYEHGQLTIKNLIP